MAPGWCTAQDLFSAITPLNYVSKAMGLASISYSTTQEEIPHLSNFRTPWWRILYTLLSIVIFIALYLNIMVQKILYDFSNDPINSTVFVLYVTLLSAGAVLSQIIGLLHREYLHLIMVKLAEVDQILINNPAQVYSNTKLFLFIELGVLYSSIFASYCANLIALLHEKSFLGLTFRTILVSLNITTGIQFMNFNILLNQRFSMLHEHLMSVCGYSYEYIYGNDASIVYADTHIHTEIPLRPVTAVMTLTWPYTDGIRPTKKFLSSSTRQNQIHILRQTHSFLCDIMNLMTKYYGVQMVFITGGQFVSIVNWLYQIILSFRRSGMKLSRLISYIMTVLIYMTMLFSIMTSGQFLSEKSKQTSKLVCRLLMHPLPPDVAMEMSAFLQQLPPTRVKLSAYGFFQFNFSVFLNIAAAVVKYNIILLKNTKK